MWFKQITCDTCYNLLDKKTVDKSFLIIGYTDHLVLNSDMTYKSYIPYSEEYIFNYAGFNKNRPEGKLFIYKPNEDDMSFNKRTFFCDATCAYDFASKNQVLLFYHDKVLSSVRTISKEMKTINGLLGGDPLRGLFTAWPVENWVINFPEIDLKQFNQSGLVVPSFKAGELELKEMTTENAQSFYEIMTEPGFMKDFDAYYNESEFVKKYTAADSINHIKAYQLLGKRRTGAMWGLSINGRTIGFVRIGNKNKWMLEFGILRSFRRKGYISKALKAIFEWCKTNGLDEINAVVEQHNHSSLELFKKFNSIAVPMQDTNQDGSKRTTLGFTIKL